MTTRNNCKVVPKFRSANIVDFGLVYSSGESKLVARVDFPPDGQIADSVEASKQIADILSKRIRKSVP